MERAAGERDEGELFERFVELVPLLERGEIDPEAFIAAHPQLARDLRELVRNWQRLNRFLCDLSSGESLVRLALSELADERARSETNTVLERLAAAREFGARFELGEEIGRGGMGSVRRVRDRVLGRDLALKRLHGEGRAPPARLLRRFLEEAELAGRLDHPGIVPIHELGLDGEGRVYFTMPLVNGRTLGDVLVLARREAEGWTRARVLEVLLKVCDAVAYAHSRRVVHRDLKPANVLVGQFGEVFVVDWGLARSLVTHESPGEAAEGVEPEASAAFTLAGEILGTPAYMAPEQAEGRRAEIDERADVYALGAILYELLAGLAPYATLGTEPSSRETLAAVRRGPPPALENLAPAAPAELVSIARRAMARAAAERYPSVPALAGDLRAYLEQRVVGAHEQGLWAETRKWLRRNRTLALTLVGLIVALGLGLSVALVLLARTRTEKSNVLRLSAFQDLDELRNEADALWPALPRHVPAYEAWLGRAHALVRRLEPDPGRGDPGLRATLADLAARRERWNTEDRWWHAQMAQLIGALEELSDAERGLVQGISPAHGWGVERRLAFARTLEERTLSAPAARAAWVEARRSIADLGECPAYGGLDLQPILGLLPIGRDPSSGLWEFAHLASGEPATRGPGGELTPTEASGVVLVLLPAGSYAMGAQPFDPRGANYDPNAVRWEYPVHLEAVAPFFLSKYELTQAQWVRATGVNPSENIPKKGAQPAITLLHPVEFVDWDDCERLIRWLGLGLPTEPEWEYACRAGTSTIWWTGDTCLTLAGKESIWDETPRESLVPHAAASSCGLLDDGFAFHAPIGSFAANPFGLFDMGGNVSEWCAGTPYHYESDIPTHGLSERAPDFRPIRGGSHYNDWNNARSSCRAPNLRTYRRSGIGVRPGRSLDHMARIQDE